MRNNLEDFPQNLLWGKYLEAFLYWGEVTGQHKVLNESIKASAEYVLSP